MKKLTARVALEKTRAQWVWLRDNPGKYCFNHTTRSVGCKKCLIVWTSGEEKECRAALSPHMLWAYASLGDLESRKKYAAVIVKLCDAALGRLCRKKCTR